MLRRAVVLGAALTLGVATAASAAEDYAREGWFIGLMGNWASPTSELYRNTVQATEVLLEPVPGRPGYPQFTRPPLNGDGTIDVNGTGLPVGSTFTHGTSGFRARLGRRLDPHFAVELDFDWLEGFDVIIPNQNPFEVETITLTMNLRTYVLTGRWQPYLVTGIGAIWAFPDGRIEQNVLPTFDELLAAVMVTPPNDVKNLAQQSNEARTLEARVVNNRQSAEFRDVGAAIRAGIGMEFFFTEHWSLNAELGYLGTFGDVGDLDHSYYSAGVAYRF